MIVDTNLIIRALTNDHPDHSARAQAFFQALLDGTSTATTVGEVIAEAVFVLASPRLYHLPRSQIEQQLSAIIRLPHLRLANKRLYVQALHLYATTPQLTFVDALLAATASYRGEPIVSFDRGYDRVPGITRVEP